MNAKPSVAGSIFLLLLAQANWTECQTRIPPWVSTHSASINEKTFLHLPSGKAIPYMACYAIRDNVINGHLFNVDLGNDNLVNLSCNEILHLGLPCNVIVNEYTVSLDLFKESLNSNCKEVFVELSDGILLSYDLFCDQITREKPKIAVPKLPILPDVNLDAISSGDVFFTRKNVPNPFPPASKTPHEGHQLSFAPNPMILVPPQAYVPEHYPTAAHLTSCLPQPCFPKPYTLQQCQSQPCISLPYRTDPCHPQTCRPQPSILQPCIPTLCEPEPCLPEPCPPQPCIPTPCLPELCHPQPCLPEPCPPQPCIPTPCPPEHCYPPPCSIQSCISLQNFPEPCLPQLCQIQQYPHQPPCVPDPCCHQVLVREHCKPIFELEPIVLYDHCIHSPISCCPTRAHVPHDRPLCTREYEPPVSHCHLGPSTIHSSFSPGLSNFYYPFAEQVCSNFLFI